MSLSARIKALPQMAFEGVNFSTGYRNGFSDGCAMSAELAAEADRRLEVAQRMADAFYVIDKGRGAEVLKSWQDMRAALAEWEALQK